MSFLSHLLHLSRPCPKFRPGQLVEFNRSASEAVHGALSGDSYMLIRARWWIRPTGAVQREWVYDGPIIEIRSGKPVLLTFGSCFSEEHLGEIVA